MTRNSARLLPFCKTCRQYKGIGPCRNPSCESANTQELESQKKKRDGCVICGDKISQTCVRCGRSYCNEHSTESHETALVKLDQCLGTCVICGSIICEYCWIFDQKGAITCQIHHSDSSDAV